MNDHPSVPKGPLAAVLLGALLGAGFAAVSTSDFMQHLDKQVHAIHCSFIPGAAKEVGETGCRVVMMSPYSSFFRESLWGGVPVSLWALAVFAFIAYRAGVLLWRQRASRAETGFLFAATLLPAGMSLLYGLLSMVELEATCKVCVGIYVSSALCLVAAALVHRRNTQPDPAPGRAPLWFGEGVAFVAVLTLTYVGFVPGGDRPKELTGCGSLVSADDPAKVMIPLTSHAGGEAAIEVLDPLCPACKAFDARLSASSLRRKLQLKAVLFPLDATCNWMVTEALHPGACAVSEAVLCAAGLGAGEKNPAAAQAVLAWAFENQDALRQLAAKDERSLRAQLEQQFPAVKGCLGGAQVKSKLTKSLRWAVTNAIPVLTPQLFVGHARMCDEDTDLGLEYTLAQMLSPEGKKAREAAQPPPRPPPPPRPTAALVEPAKAMAESDAEAPTATDAGADFAPAAPILDAPTDTTGEAAPEAPLPPERPAEGEVQP